MTNSEPLTLIFASGCRLGRMTTWDRPVDASTPTDLFPIGVERIASSTPQVVSGKPQSRGSPTFPSPEEIRDIAGIVLGEPPRVDVVSSESSLTHGSSRSRSGSWGPTSSDHSDQANPTVYTKSRTLLAQDLLHCGHLWDVYSETWRRQVDCRKKKSSALSSKSARLDCGTWSRQRGMRIVCIRGLCDDCKVEAFRLIMDYTLRSLHIKGPVLDSSTVSMSWFRRDWNI
jgi:hypothetical protein